ncbi:MAG: DUF4845 domain-containing protein [Proteobacteria bacterium]|nr:DUF4845 domain-containing protein [Pseudomonadota bacterium]
MAQRVGVMNKRYQSGMSMWTLLMIALVAGFFGLIAIKMIPVYLSDMKISSAMSSLARDPQAQNASKMQIKEMIRKRLELDMAEQIADLNKDLMFETDGRARIVRIAYDSVTPLFFNIFILIEFDHAEKVGTVGG